MKTTIEQALRRKLAIGAHPRLCRSRHFGRVSWTWRRRRLQLLFRSGRALAEVLTVAGARLVHVKPHGALYNQAVGNADCGSDCGKALLDGTGCRPGRLAGSRCWMSFGKPDSLLPPKRSRTGGIETGWNFAFAQVEDALIRDPAEAAGRR